MRLKLTRLVWITCIALLGIIALQVFWLFKSYREQKEKLLATVENTLLETQVLSGVSSSLSAVSSDLADDILDLYSEEVQRQPDKETQLILRGFEAGPDSLGSRKAGQKALLRLLGLDSIAAKTYSLPEYKEKIRIALSYRNVRLPFEMALVNKKDQILAATIDADAFRKVKIKNDITYTLPVALNPGLKGRVQLAFPSATFYLLKGMWVILVLSLCLLTVCAFSFVYMVALFYKQKKIAEIRNDFMNNMTHELKTPISSVSVALELLQDESVTVAPETREEYFSIATNELERLTMLVDKVLKMSAYEKMEVAVKPEWFSVEPWLSEVINSIKPLRELVKTRIDVWVDPPSLQLYADKSHMSSALQNLLENAIKYADKNKPYLQVNINAREDEGNVYLTVIDNGIGIQEEHQSKVFDKFFRVPTGDKHETKGYGLGLSYVNEIVRLHRGEIQLISEWKRGTAFTLRIPKSR